ncbi:hypothetical protein CEXT_119671 [Caerostris extrusa]|uniref:Uncharacterized protein n=1 Tax=Caerostris extrusa TaxID=172846 RepID=A0AAV4XMN1_CAEEX|nr:hypothetical protein CEXT_119671 [Caerostris extrusa]
MRSTSRRKRYLTHVIWAPRVRGESEGKDHKKERNHLSDPLTESLTQACSEVGISDVRSTSRRKRYLTHVIWAPRVRGESEGEESQKRKESPFRSVDRLVNPTMPRRWVLIFMELGSRMCKKDSFPS